jgi:hypothetical protein
MLKKSGMMYKRAFDIKFFDTPAVIANGVRDRHNIVHRNGKTEDGTEGSWGLPEILALKAAVLDFAGSIDSQVKALSDIPPTDATAVSATLDDPIEF